MSGFKFISLVNRVYNCLNLITKGQIKNMSKREFVVILVITLIVVAVWVVSDLVHTRSTSQSLPDVKGYSDSVDPQFDKDVLGKISSLATPAPAPSGAPPVASPSPVLSPSPSPKASIGPSFSPRSTASPAASLRL